ncbi:hypothetical protein ASE66_24555 [Bosea sp. Root483D1]|uniref:phosphotransferase family protein n=1 Tax=Bosea sp. Root483D1 TaxID=1736544 RepID=UPI00070CA897|nr:aminoglycoside phosphotransferase family protein [Bosea sp. Root483D1]KRE11688.1 hypothetical protein ASE66_24555 [Bosea sp. Root483D1]
MKKAYVAKIEIESFLNRMFSEVGNIVQLKEGEESRAFAFKARDGEYVLRLNGHIEDFRKDAYVYQNFTSAELPVPKIVSVGAFDQDLSYCVSRRAPGITLQDLNEASLSAVLTPVAEVLSAISSIEPEQIGFGPFGSDGVGRFASWRSFVLAVADPMQYDWAALGLGEKAKVVARALEFLLSSASQYSDEHRLVHGDFGSNNVLSEGGRITGVIDWSEALIGDPLYDLANIFFWRPWLTCMEHQARYFEHRDPALVRAQRFLGYQLRIGLEQLYQSALNGECEDAEWALLRCETISDLSTFGARDMSS